MNRLRINAITSIGAVEDGDNPAAKIMFWKRNDTSHIEPVPGPEPVTKEGDSMTFDIDTLDESGQAFVHELQQEIDGLKAKLPVEEPALPDDLPEAVAKRLEAQDTAIEKERVEKDRIAKELAALQDERATEKYTALAKATENIIGPADEVAPLFKAMGEAAPAEFDDLYARLGTLMALDGFEKVLQEHGQASVGGTARDQINAHAQEIKKNDPTLTAAAARAQAWAENPDLVRQAREEG